MTTSIVILTQSAFEHAETRVGDYVYLGNIPIARVTRIDNGRIYLTWLSLVELGSLQGG